MAEVPDDFCIKKKINYAGALPNMGPRVFLWPFFLAGVLRWRCEYAAPANCRHNCRQCV